MAEPADFKSAKREAGASAMVVHVQQIFSDPMGLGGIPLDVLTSDDPIYMRKLVALPDTVRPLQRFYCLTKQ